MTSMLEIKHLTVATNGKEILHDLNLEIGLGETHALFGRNGSGKTTLLMAMMGLGGYEVVQGTIRFKGKEITHLPTYERARMGIGIAFQRPPTIHGLRTRDMVNIAAGNGLDAEALAQRLEMKDFLDRDINAGFSGGEIKRSELLQLLAQKPELIMLDEPDSGVDLESVRLLGDVVKELLQKDLPPHERQKSGLIITHSGFILDYVEADRGHVLSNGTLACSGIPRELLSTIRTMGYEECERCQLRRLQES